MTDSSSTIEFPRSDTVGAADAPGARGVGHARPVDTTIRLGVPKGRMYDAIERLLRDAGVNLGISSRGYRPTVSLDGFEAKILKPRAIVEMLAFGSRDLGFAGADWVAEAACEGGAFAENPPVELLDTGFDPVRLIVAAPDELLDAAGALPSKRLVVASEYVALATRWIAERGLDASLLRSYGATEVLPPEDADCIIDNTATGATLAANGLRIIDELMRSSTRLYASRQAMDDPAKREAIERFVLLVQSVLEARQRVMLEVNVGADRLDAIVAVLPCMRQPTVSSLLGNAGYAVKAAVPRKALPTLIPELRARGGTDIIVTNTEQIVR